MAERRNSRNSRNPGGRPTGDRSGQQNPYDQCPYNGPHNQGPYNGGPNQGPYNNGNYNQGPGRGGRQGGYYPPEQDPHYRNTKRKKKKKIIFVIEILVLLILAALLFFFFTFNKVKRQNIAKGDIIINEEISPEEAKVLEGYTNIALFGVDTREGKLEIDTHSDALMVASINNKTKDIKIVSVYRDTYLDNTNGEYRKATECYYFGGPNRSINMLNKNLDLNISDFVTIDFNGLAKVVDLMDGIEIDVQEDEIQWINGYQEEGSEVTGIDIVPVTNSGLQTLNGLQAMSYCRIRYTEGSDYRRTERQRTVIEKILAKAKTMDLLKLNSLVQTMAPNVLTSLSTTEILGLAKDVASYDLSETMGFPFNLQTANISAGDCVVPQNLANNVIELHNRLFGSDGYTPSDTVQEISNIIINETGIQ